MQLDGLGPVTAVSVDVPKGVFGNVNGTPVPNDNSVITTQPKFSAMSVIQIYQPLSQLYNVHLNVSLLKVGKQLSRTAAATAAADHKFGERGVLRAAADAERAGCSE